MKKVITLALLMSSTLLLAGQASAGACGNAFGKATNEVFKNVFKDVCLGVDTSQKNNSKFLYVNPDSNGCDLGLDMPGLPGFGMRGGDFSLCGMAKAITSSTVSELNSVTRDAMNSAVQAVNTAGSKTIGTNVLGAPIDVGAMVEQQVRSAATGVAK